jgi:hypothetical protein
MLQKKWKRASKMVDFISSSFLTFFLKRKRKEHSTGAEQYRAEQHRAENTPTCKNE